MGNRDGREQHPAERKRAGRKWIPPVVALTIGILVSEALCRLFFSSPFVGRQIAIGMLHDARWGAIHEPGASYRSQNPVDETDFGMSINSLGFRGPEIDEARDDTFRMVFVGDSFTEGYGVESKDGFVAQSGRVFRERSPESKMEVINTGIRGGSPSTYWRQLDRTLALDPDGIVLVAFDNDLSDDFHYSSDWDHVRADALRLIEHLPFESRLVQLVAELGVRTRHAWAVGRSESIVGGTVTRSSELVYGSGAIDTDPIGFYVRPDLWQVHWDWSREYLEAIAGGAAVEGVKLAIAYIPAPQIGIHGDCCAGVYPVAEGKRPGEDNPFRDWLRDFAEDWQLPFIDVSETILELEAAGDPDPVYAIPNGHLNARGNALFGELVYERLRGWVQE